MAILHSFPAVAAPVFETLVESTVKGTIVLTCSAILLFALRRASAAYRHMVWVCAFCAALALPALMAMPAWRISAPALAWLRPATRSLTPAFEASPPTPSMAPDEAAQDPR